MRLCCVSFVQAHSNRTQPVKEQQRDSTVRCQSSTETSSQTSVEIAIRSDQENSAPVVVVPPSVRGSSACQRDGRTLTSAKQRNHAILSKYRKTNKPKKQSRISGDEKPKKWTSSRRKEVGGTSKVSLKEDIYTYQSQK